MLASDALAIINYINAFGIGPLPAGAAAQPPYLDTLADNLVLLQDVLEVINFINAFGIRLPGPEGSTDAEPPASAATDTRDATDAVFGQLGSSAGRSAVRPFGYDELWSLLLSAATDQGAARPRRR